MTTAGREVGSIRETVVMIEKIKAVEVVDLRLRSERVYKARDHGREGRLEKRKYEEEKAIPATADGNVREYLDLKRKQRLNNARLLGCS